MTVSDLIAELQKHPPYQQVEVEVNEMGQCWYEADIDSVKNNAAKVLITLNP